MAARIDSPVPVAAVGKRRTLALVKFLSAGELTWENLPRDNPLIAGATMAELEEAFQIIAKANKNDLEIAYRKFMAGEETFTIGPKPSEFLPISQLRYRNISYKQMIQGVSLMILTDIDVFQVNYKFWEQYPYKLMALCLRSLISKQPGDFYKLQWEGNDYSNGTAHKIVEIPQTFQLMPTASMSLGREVQSFIRTANPKTEAARPEIKDMLLGMPLHFQF